MPALYSPSSRPPPPRPRPAFLRHGAGLLRMCWPILLSQAALLGNGIADAIMAGHFGTPELAAVGIGGSVWITWFATCFGIINGVAPLIGKHFGAGQPGEIAGYANAAALVAVLLSLLGIVLLQFAPATVYRLTGVAPGVALLASRYVAIIAWALPAILLARVFYALTTSINLPRPVMVINATVVTIKIPVSYALMHGSLGLPRLGLPGCAIGTVLMFWLMLLGSAIYLVRDPRYRQLGRQHVLRWWDRPRMGRMLALGIPIGAGQLLEIGSLAVTALLVGRLGAHASAGHQILISLTGLMFMLPMSLGIALQTLVAQARGAGDPALARAITQTGMAMATLSGLLSCAILFLLREPVLRLYTADPAVVAAGMAIFPLFLCYQFFDGMQCVAGSALRGYESTFVPMIILLLALWGIGVGAGACLAYGLAAPLVGNAFAMPGLSGFWFASALGLALATLGLCLLLWHHATVAHAVPARQGAALAPAQC